MWGGLSKIHLGDKELFQGYQYSLTINALLERGGWRKLCHFWGKFKGRGHLDKRELKKTKVWPGGGGTLQKQR